MKKIVYLIRHSEVDKSKYKKNDDPDKENKSIKLSENGKLMVKKNLKYLKNIKNIYCSDYKRAIQTAKQINKNIVIDKRFGERIVGLYTSSLTPSEYYFEQIKNLKLKQINGESREEIQERMYNGILDILKNNDESVVISHGSSITFLLMKFCDIKIIDIENKIRRIIFNGNIIFEGKFNFLETFKLTFEDNKIINIENIKY